MVVECVSLGSEDIPGVEDIGHKGFGIYGLRGSNVLVQHTLRCIHCSNRRSA